MSKPFMTHDQQLQKLRAKHLVISDSRLKHDAFHVRDIYLSKNTLAEIVIMPIENIYRVYPIYKEENIYRCYTSGLEVNQLLDNIKQFDREEK